MINSAKYDGFPFVSNIDKYVQDELADRSLRRIRERNNPYVKITPGFTPDGSIGSKIILKGIEASAYETPATYNFKDLCRYKGSLYRIR